MFFQRRFTTIFPLVCALISVACSSFPTSSQPAQQESQTSIPEEQGIDLTKMDQVMDVIQRLDLPIDSVLVIHRDQLVYEEYPNPDYGPDDMHLLYSVTKSFTSALIGIAIEEGFIEDVDQKVVDLFPEWTIENLDHRKQELTIEHLLTMSCGFEWEGPDDNLHTWGKPTAVAILLSMCWINPWLATQKRNGFTTGAALIYCRRS